MQPLHAQIVRLFTVVGAAAPMLDKLEVWITPYPPTVVSFRAVTPRRIVMFNAVAMERVLDGRTTWEVLGAALMLSDDERSLYGPPPEFWPTLGPGTLARMPVLEAVTVMQAVMPQPRLAVSRLDWPKDDSGASEMIARLPARR